MNLQALMWIAARSRNLSEGLLAELHLGGKRTRSYWETFSPPSLSEGKHTVDQQIQQRVKRYKFSSLSGLLLRE